MEWFQRITGFRERDYAETQQRLRLRDGRLFHNEDWLDRLVGERARGWSVGRLETPTLGELRQRVGACEAAGKTRVQCIVGDARELHRLDDNAGALFQVASQFNLLEMVGPDITPEHGVTGYVHDRTQGPACAMAAGAGTIYRNYLVPVGDRVGQTAAAQIDCLADLTRQLAQGTDRPESELLEMRNGYACRRPTARRCRWHISSTVPRGGNGLHGWCSRRPTRRRCWPPCSTGRSTASHACF